MDFKDFAGGGSKGEASEGEATCGRSNCGGNCGGTVSLFPHGSGEMLLIYKCRAQQGEQTPAAVTQVKGGRPKHAKDSCIVS